MKKINKAEEIENIYLREWFEEHEEKVKDSDFLISLKGRHNLASLQQIKEKSEARQTKKTDSENGGCFLWFIVWAVMGVVVTQCNTKPTYKRHYTPSQPTSSGSGKCNYPSDRAIDGTRCGKRAASER